MYDLVTLRISCNLEYYPQRKEILGEREGEGEALLLSQATEEEGFRNK